jgi:thymidylate kinase
MSKIIVVEGPDRVGKNTQSNLLSQRFREVGKRSTVVEVPIKGAVTYRLIYWMLQSGAAKSLPKTFQFLQFLNRKIFQWFTLPKLERQNDYIVFDRWSLSTSVYGQAEGLSKRYTEKLSSMLREADYTVVLLGPTYMKAAEDVYESDAVLQTRVRRLYADWAGDNSGRSSVVVAAGSKEEVSDKVVANLLASGVVPLSDIAANNVHM